MTHLHTSHHDTAHRSDVELEDEGGGDDFGGIGGRIKAASGDDAVGSSAAS